MLFVIPVTKGLLGLRAKPILSVNYVTVFSPANINAPIGTVW
jgi:hypothetical protein